MYEGETIADFGILDENDLQLLWLPLAHAFGKVLISAQLACGFASAIDGRVDKIVENMGRCKPTFMGAAPRIFEKAHAQGPATQQRGRQGEVVHRRLRGGPRGDRRRLHGEAVPSAAEGWRTGCSTAWCSARSATCSAAGCGSSISGSAPLNGDIAEWFHAAGLLILEGYGLTETAAGAFINRLENYKLGTVGQVFDGSQVRLSKDGEVQIRARA